MTSEEERLRYEVKVLEEKCCCLQRELDQAKSFKRAYYDLYSSQEEELPDKKEGEKNK